MIRVFLTWVLVFLPFQRKTALLVSNPEISQLIKYIDEITIVVLFPLAMVKLYRNDNIRNPFCLTLLFSMAILVLSGFISGFVNSNSFFVTATGIYDYIKNIFVIIIYFAYFKDFSDFQKVFRLLLSTAVILGIVSFIQEIWALGSLYIFGQNFDNPDNYIFQKDTDIRLLSSYWRFGVFRTSSLMVSTINSGLYGLLILNIYLCITRRINVAVVAALLSSVFTSVSRIVYIGFVVVSGLQIVRGKRWLAILLVPIIACMLLMSNLWDFNIMGFLSKNNVQTEQRIELEFNGTHLEEIKTEDKGLAPFTESRAKHYREYTRGVAMEIWKDHPFWGVGPGMFGGVVSVAFKSHIYNEYNFKNKNYLELLKSIDNFWPQMLAETGIIGVAAFAAIFILIFIMLYIKKNQAVSEELNGLFAGLIAYEIVIILYTFGLGLNIPSIFYTYCALVGIGLKCLEEA